MYAGAISKQCSYNVINKQLSVNVIIQLLYFYAICTFTDSTRGFHSCLYTSLTAEHFAICGIIGIVVIIENYYCSWTVIAFH